MMSYASRCEAYLFLENTFSSGWAGKIDPPPRIAGKANRAVDQMLLRSQSQPLRAFQSAKSEQ